MSMRCVVRLRLPLFLTSNQKSRNLRSCFFCSKDFSNVKKINWLDHEEGLRVMSGKSFVTTHRGWIIYMPVCECCLQQVTWHSTMIVTGEISHHPNLQPKTKSRPYYMKHEYGEFQGFFSPLISSKDINE